VAPSTFADRSIALTPLLVGPLPDDPLGKGRCFGPYGHASFTIDGIKRRDGFITCGDYPGGTGDPTRANGVYHFVGAGLPPTARLVRFSAVVGIDEDSSPSQAGAGVTWELTYYGEPICTRSTTWSGGPSRPIEMNCDIPGNRRASIQALAITQQVALTSDGQFWAGLQDPEVVAAGR
jgi:hypothetical protein